MKAYIYRENNKERGFQKCGTDREDCNQEGQRKTTM